MIHPSKQLYHLQPQSYQQVSQEREIKHLRELLRKQGEDMAALSAAYTNLHNKADLKDRLIEIQDKQIKVLKLQLLIQGGGVTR